MSARTSTESTASVGKSADGSLLRQVLEKEAEDDWES